MRTQRRPEPIPIARAASEARSQSSALTGRLESIPLFDVCHFLLLNRRTGTLTVRSGDRTLRIYFVEGMIHDISDEAMRTGEHLLLDAVQWTKGSFALDPAPPGVARRITEATEAILLEAARTIDECRSRDSGDGPAKSQEEIFKERQVFAGELAEAFRTAIDPDGTRGDRGGATGDPLDRILRDVATARGHLVIRGTEGILRAATGARPYRSPIDACEALAGLGIETRDLLREGRTVERRIERLGGWFHIRGTRVSGDLQVRFTHLRTSVPACEEIGIDPSILGAPSGNGPGGGLLLWSGMPGGLRSSALAAWLTRANLEDGAGPEGATVWIEDNPTFAWEALPGASAYGGHPGRVEIRSILEWNPQRVVIDSARTPRAARLALDLTEAGISTIAIVAGLVQSGTVARLESLLERDGVPRSGATFPGCLRRWIGVLPLGDSGLIATQIENAGADRPQRSYRDAIGRLEREGRLAPEAAARILHELSDLA